MSESVPSLCEVGRSLLEKTEILKRTLLENKIMEDVNKNNQSFFQSVYNSESVQKVMNQVQDTAKDVMSKSLAENVENLKNNLSENYDSVQKVVNQVQDTAKDAMGKSLGENLNSVQKVVNLAQDSAMGKSLTESVGNLKNSLADNVKEKVQNATNAAAEMKESILSKSISENAEALKHNVQENLGNLKSTVEHAATAGVEMKNKVLDNVREVKNSVTESETYKRVSEFSEKDARKTIETVTSNLQKQMTPGFERFLEGPRRDSPPLDKSLISIIYFLRDLIWIWLLSFPIFFKTLVGKFTTKKEKDLKDKVVVVTGAANGFGKEMAFQFAKLGCKVACVDVSKEANKETALSIIYGTGRKDAVKSYGCDISKPEQTRKLAEDVVKDFGGVDILVNNAGILYGHEILGGSDEMIQKVLDVNLAGNFWMLRSFLPIMMEKKSGHIVFMSSASGINPVGRASSYSATKSGLLALAYSLDDELRLNPELDDIKVTTILPYFVVTNPEFAKRWRLRIPPLEVTDAVSQMVTGIRREYFVFQVPGFDLGYFTSTLLRMLPMELYRMVKNALYIDILLDENNATLTSMEMNTIKTAN